MLKKDRLIIERDDQEFSLSVAADLPFGYINYQSLGFGKGASHSLCGMVSLRTNALLGKNIVQILMFMFSVFDSYCIYFLSSSVIESSLSTYPSNLFHFSFVIRLILLQHTGPDIRWVDNGKQLFRVRLRLVSSAFTTETKLQAFFQSCQKLQRAGVVGDASSKTKVGLLFF